LTITFDGSPVQPRATEYFVTYYFESGLAFTPETDIPGDSFTRCGGGISGFAEDGSAYLQQGVSLEFSFTNGLSFSLLSVDLAGFAGPDSQDIDIEFVGHKSDGSLVTYSFSGTGIAFQTYNFDPEFTNLANVEVFGTSWSLDNLVVQPDPPVLSISLVDFFTANPPESGNFTFVPTAVLSFSTISNQSYALEFSSDLSLGGWTTLPGVDQNGDPASNLVGDGGRIQFVDNHAAAVSQRFYRLHVLP
jgi:hypothetical protein